MTDTTSKFREADAHTRSIIGTSLNETLFVEAGAGTGKTRALVDRVVALVTSGVPVDQIAAITFTEKAAAELRERVRTAMEDRLRDGEDPKAQVVGALESLDRAQISTIHAFCQTLLRSFAAEAGVDPDFDIQDEVLTERRRQERWRMYLEALGGNEAARLAFDRALGLGLTPRDLEKLAIELSNRGDLARVIDGAPFATEEPGWPDLRLLERQLEDTGFESVDEADTLRGRIAGVIGVVRAILVRPRSEWETQLASGGGFLEADHKGADAKWGGKAPKAAAAAAANTVRDALNVLLRRLRSVALAGVMPYIVQFVREDEEARAREGLITFDDLILRVRDLLVGSHDARRSLRRRLRALLIDEFQDTDPLQVEIAMAFASDPDSGRLEPGRLFLVGDPKQSIYRFRRADMAVYAGTRARIEESGAKLLELALNQRSRGPLLEWINAVFERVIGGGHQPDVQPAYRPIHSNRTEQVAGPGVAWFGGPSQDPARTVRAQEARDVADLCRQAVEHERWQVSERDGVTRDSRYRDIAVLLPRRTGLASLERALASRRIPYRVEGGSLIYRTQEVRDLVNCLTAIDDPADEVAVVAALRSPAFACSDVELAQFKADGGRFNYRVRKSNEMSGRVAAALQTLERYHTRRHDRSLAALIEAFVSECGQVETGILHEGDRNTFRRVRFMAQQARSFEAGKPESLRAFVTWLEHQAGGGMLDNEGAGVDDDEDAVRILTVHGSKGLEFPIVIMAGTSAAPMKGRPPTFMREFAGQEIAVRVGTSGGNRLFTLGDCDRLIALEGRHDDAEFDRMLYVAATRARDHLLFSLHHKVTTSGARILLDAGATEFAPPIEIERDQSRGKVIPFEGMEVDPPEAIDATGFVVRRTQLMERARRRRYTSATAIKAAEQLRGATDPARREHDDETEPWSRGRAGTRIGRAVHAAIQSLPLVADDAAIDAVAKAQAVAEAVPQRSQDVARLVRWVLRHSDAWKRATAASRALREVPFAMQVDGTVLEGFIDLVIDGPDGIEIVDWKTDAISKGQVEERLLEYRLQAGLYVLGLESATGCKVSRVSYVFASPSVEIDIPDPPALARDARERLIKNFQ